MTTPNAAHAETPRPKKRSLGTSDKVPSPTPDVGYSVWIEGGEWFTAPTIDPRKFGQHAYAGAYAARSGMGNCPCGCEMRSSSSSGPVDPFGACPLNPLPAEAETPRPTPRTDAEAGYPDESGCWKSRANGEYVEVAFARALETELAEMTAENAFLRVKAQKLGCPYNNTHENGACKSGYPGCACADDLMAMQSLCPEDEEKAAVRLGQRVTKLETELQAERLRGAWQTPETAPVGRIEVIAAYRGVYKPTSGFIVGKCFFQYGDPGSSPFTHWIPIPPITAHAEGKHQAI